MDIAKIFEDNASWVASRIGKDPGYFESLSQGQDPDMLYIGCSDSRVTAEDMMGAEPGDLFVHRNIANVVSNLDISAMSVINYSVVHLHVKHIVVCGHYGCGGVKAAMQSSNLGILNPWLKNIRDIYRLHKDELNAIADEDKRYSRLVELNVQEQCVNVLKIPEVQQAYRSGKLTMHGWVFDIASGKIVNLEIDFAKVLQDIEGIYDLD